jgi:hypothetical protein
MTKAAQAYTRPLLPGQQFNRLTAIEPAGYRRFPSGGRTPLWRFRCECGKQIIAQAHSVKNGYSRSCGCLKQEAAAMTGRSHRKHGLCRTRLYRILYSMAGRCEDPKHPSYDNYGARGITVCEEWRRDPRCFQEWAIANGYEEGLSIDRINNDLGYFPENCRWATSWEQAQNRRTTVYNGHDDAKEIVKSLLASGLIKRNVPDRKVHELAQEILRQPRFRKKGSRQPTRTPIRKSA